MITKKELTKFIKEAIKEAPFEGTKYIDLDCTDAESRELYLVFACEKEENETKLWCKIAYNCDDLQCDYDWDWYMPEEIYYECDDCLSWTDKAIDREAEVILDSAEQA